MPATEALRSYLTTVRRITGAGTASLYFCSASAQHESTVVHDGALPPVPELLSVDAARRLASGDATTDPAILHFRQSSADGAYLLGMNISGFQSLQAGKQKSAAGFERRKLPAPPAGDTGEDWMVWIGMRYSGTSRPPFPDNFASLAEGFSGAAPESVPDWLSWTLAMGAYLAWEAYRLALLTLDPISRLPGRVEFQACLQRELEKGIRNQQALGLVLVNPDEFGLINHRLGHDKGDAALQEVARRLSSNIRSDDKVFRYGGAVFGVVLPGSSLSSANAAAEKLRHALTQAPYLDGTAQFAFSAGVAVHDNFEASDVLSEITDLLRHADQALNVAKLSGGAQTVSWGQDGTTAMGNLDRLSGIFTADTEKDYRNMLMLWDTITVISSRPDARAISSEFVDRIGSTLKPDRVGLYAYVKGEPPRLLAANRKQAGGQDRVPGEQELSLSDEQRALMALARKHRRTERLQLTAGVHGKASQQPSRGRLAYAVPLLARDDCLGCLYLDGTGDSLSLDTSDLIFLDALANQIAVALDRAELASRWKQEQERESERLRAEVQELRQSLQHTRLVYESPGMDTVLGTLGKVVPTDVTVLISGESGTGKEMLARTLHELSARSTRPFITVDCGAIAHSLMETELFGHVKGAYTGAQGSSQGRILQAASGTLFLDEIGEIPLEIQTKLLRFLQEKEFTPVGATRSQTVDVRIVAATNRDLADEVARGSFRSDLYYRLQVVTVTAPPLRERPDDILPLARYFLEKFSVDYGKHDLSLDNSARSAMLDYPWPGNVRELQHRILQAVVMCEGNVIEKQELRLTTGRADTATQQVLASRNTTQPAPPRVLPDSRQETSDTMVVTPETDTSPWAALREALKSQVVAALESSNTPVPLGRWLEEDLVLAADRAANGTASRASSALGMAETTFRRRLGKVKREFQAGLMSRTGNWAAIQPVLSRLVRAGNTAGDENIFEQARRMLLEEVVASVEQNGALGSALMGVTSPTYRRWISSLFPR